MKIETYDWTGKELTPATVQTARLTANHPTWAVCSVQFYNHLAQQGCSTRRYAPLGPLTGVEFQMGDGDLVWQCTANMNPDMLILGNETETHIFYGISGA